MKHQSIILTLILLSLLCISCGSKVAVEKNPIGDEVWSSVKTIEFSFNDASLPPEYHRSYHVKVTETMAYLSVTSYSQSLLKKTYDIEPQQFQKAIEALKRLDIRRDNVQSEPCSGGESESFSIYGGSPNAQELFSGWHDTCGSSTMNVPFGAIPNALNAAFPQSINSLVDTTREQ